MSDDNNMESDDNEGVSLAPFDPKASDFIPEPEKININASASASAHQKPRLTLRSTSGLPGDGKADWKPFHSAIPLYPSTIWSPSPHTNPVISAGIPQKPSWDSFTNTPTRAGFEPLTPGEHFASPLPGLGMPQGQTNFLHAEDGRIRGANTGGSEHVGRFARSEQYHMLGAQDSLPSPVDPSVRAMSFQPPQHLARLARQQSDSSSELDSDRRSQAHGQPANVSNLPHANLTINVHANTAVDGHKSGSSGSNAISDHHTQQRPVSNGAKGEVWSERLHPRGLRRGLKDPQAEWEQAFDGALTVLAAVNPEHFQMSMGTRVVNIKSEFPGNVIKSVRVGRYSVIEKVAERIMKIWTARHDWSEKVLLLFSINGSKKFCGIAEMSGPWDTQIPVEGWEENPSAKNKCVGSIPLTWVFIKDVSYLHFSHIRQHHNDHPVGNMWNGMNFEQDVGRAVMEQYVRTPSTASILGHPKNYYENFELDKDANLTQRRGAFSNRGARGGRGGSIRAGLPFNAPFRRPQNATSDDSDGDEATPTAAKNAGCLSINGSAPPTYNVPVLGNTKLAPGQVASVTVDGSGNLVLLPSPTGDHFKADRAPMPSRSFNSPRDLCEAAGKLYGGLQQPSSTNSLRAPGGPVLHPAVSMDSLTQQRGHGYVASGFVSPAAHNHSLSFTRDGPRVPGSASMPSFAGKAGRSGARGLLNTPRSLTESARLVEDTPTHRPHSHLDRGVHLSKLVTKADSVTSDDIPSVDQLKATFHMLHAEKCITQYQLQDPATTSMDARLLNAKMARLTLEIREVELTLYRLGVAANGNVSPERLDSSSEQDSVSSGRQHISPIRAADGRPLYSASMVGSPLSTSYGEFGGDSDDFQPKHKASTSWDLRAKAVADLVDSPKQGNQVPAPAHPSHQNSGFFPNSGLGIGGKFSFHGPRT